jgi:hypothetical protein
MPCERTFGKPLARERVFFVQGELHFTNHVPLNNVHPVLMPNCVVHKSHTLGRSDGSSLNKSHTLGRSGGSSLTKPHTLGRPGGSSPTSPTHLAARMGRHQQRGILKQI